MRRREKNTRTAKAPLSLSLRRSSTLARLTQDSTAIAGVNMYTTPTDELQIKAFTSNDRLHTLVGYYSCGPAWSRQHSRPPGPQSSKSASVGTGRAMPATSPHGTRVTATPSDWSSACSAQTINISRPTSTPRTVSTWPFRVSSASTSHSSLSALST